MILNLCPPDDFIYEQTVTPAIVHKDGEVLVQAEVITRLRRI